MGPRVNEQIEAEKVRVVNADGEMVGVISKEEGIEIAFEAGLDLVEVSPPFDASGGTAFLGVSIMFEMLCAMTGKG